MKLDYIDAERVLLSFGHRTFCSTIPVEALIYEAFRPEYPSVEKFVSSLLHAELALQWQVVAGLPIDGAIECFTAIALRVNLTYELEAS